MAFVEAGTFEAAAERIGSAQSAVSRHLKKFEDWFGWADRIRCADATDAPVKASVPVCLPWVPADLADPCRGVQTLVSGAGVHVVGFGAGDLFGLVEDAVVELLAARGETPSLSEAKLFFELGNPFAQLPVACLELTELSTCRQ